MLVIQKVSFRSKVLEWIEAVLQNQESKLVSKDKFQIKRNTRKKSSFYDFNFT